VLKLKRPSNQVSNQCIQNTKEKYNDEDVIISPADTRRYAEDSGDYPEEEPPAGVILCYQEDLFEYVTDTHSKDGGWRGLTRTSISMS